MSIVCVNSTIPVRRKMRRDGHISPLHYWGYQPTATDVLLAHRINRVEITLRYRLGGIDPWTLARTYWYLARGARGLFLATQPDLWQALPWLKRRFPDRRFVAWVWTDWEVDRYLARLRPCDHVLCLTPGAKQRLDAAGMADRSSYVIWGCDPTHYRALPDMTTDTDVLIAGLTNRDTALLRHGLGLRRFSALVTRETIRVLALSAADQAGCRVTSIETEEDMCRAYQRCRVTWIPIPVDDPYLSGVTNLIESLLCGTAVIMADRTRIPPDYLHLRGVFLYRTGDANDFIRATDEALAYMRTPSARESIRQTAAENLNGIALQATARQALGLPPA
jgi:glycosyltransferase involved in cell wall biosynthesis